MGNTASNERQSEYRDSKVRSKSQTYKNRHEDSNIPQLIIQTKSWNKDSYGLFDYESRDIQKKTLKITGTCKLIRNQIMTESIEIEPVSENHSDPDTLNSKKEQQLGRLLFKNGGYWIYHKNQVDVSQIYQNPEEKLWLVIKKYQSKTYHKGYRIQKNDIIKVGRIRLRVRDIDYPEDKESSKSSPMSDNLMNQNNTLFIQDNNRASKKQTNEDLGGSLDINEIEVIDREMLSNQFEISVNPTIDMRKSQTQNKIDQSTKNNKAKNDELNKSTSSSGNQCRICWGSEDELELGKDFNPLISPCKCHGSIGQIHLKCLKEWLETNKTLKTHRGQVVVKFKKLDCELCKQMFPFQIAYNNQIIDIVEVEKPESNYIILESLTYKASKVFYIINTDSKTQMKVGRGQDCDVRITDDISVSRCHALIWKTTKGDYILEDFNSKFGTLVQLQYPMLLSTQLQQNGQIVFQSGKTCLQIQIKNQVSCVPSCFRPNMKSQNDKLTTVDNKNFFPLDFFKQAVSLNKSASTQARKPKILAKIINEDHDDEEPNEMNQNDDVDEFEFQNNQSLYNDRSSLPNNYQTQQQFGNSNIYQAPFENGVENLESYGNSSMIDASSNRLRSLPHDEGITSQNHMNSRIPRLGDLFLSTRRFNLSVIQVIEENQEENFDLDYEDDEDANLDLQFSNIQLNQTMALQNQLHNIENENILKSTLRFQDSQPLEFKGLRQLDRLNDSLEGLMINPTFGNPLHSQNRISHKENQDDGSQLSHEEEKVNDSNLDATLNAFQMNGQQQLEINQIDDIYPSQYREDPIIDCSQSQTIQSNDIDGLNYQDNYSYEHQSARAKDISISRQLNFKDQDKYTTNVLDCGKKLNSKQSKKSQRSQKSQGKLGNTKTNLNLQSPTLNGDRQSSDRKQDNLQQQDYQDSISYFENDDLEVVDHLSVHINDLELKQALTIK